ncbi:MAG: alpha/beta fold hydrolase [Marinobacter sp.]|uniref:alpha/beta hydrolase n=1 Tax=Marinobacter sp. TaxID=50741 RepID=UPI00299E8740|nr:alpha/beta fold hydrolase [Marinobacter sp.]MDX1755059.1 alpha/beta fold hydrolase [Marinobacter sp.]
MTELSYIKRETNPNPTATVIWLHGLGASGHDFEPVVPELGLPADAAVRFIFPHAPEMPVTVNGGLRMPAWYDIKAMDIDRVIDTEQLLQSAEAVSRLIEGELAQGIDSSRIVVAGFSQGGAVAYQVALSFAKPLAGLLGLSTYFATADTVEPSQANRELPIQVYHGVYDPIVPEALGQKSVAQFRELGYEPEYTTYPMDHSVCLEEIVAIGQFLRDRLKL